AVATLADGGAIGTGTFDGNNVGFGPPPAPPKLSALGAQDVCVAKYDATGSPVWQAQAAAADPAAVASGLGLATYADGSVALIGQFTVPTTTPFSFLSAAGIATTATVKSHRGLP